MDFKSAGLIQHGAGPMSPIDRYDAWKPVTSKGDPRLFPARGGGRRMRHPYLDHIVYPRMPDKTLNFGFDVLRRVPSTVLKTATATASAKYPEYFDDVKITEIWQAEQLSTITGLFHQFDRYWTYMLPPGRYVGWQPRDLTPKSYFVEILNVALGSAEDFNVEELGDRRPWMMREQLSVTFRLIRDVSYPAGVVASVGL